MLSSGVIPVLLIQRSVLRDFLITLYLAAGFVSLKKVKSLFRLASLWYMAWYSNSNPVFPCTHVFHIQYVHVSHNDGPYYTALSLTPINTTVCLGSTTQFMCSAANATIITYMVNSKAIPPLPPYVNISAPIFMGNMTTAATMTIFSASDNDTLITCQVFQLNGPALTSTAYLRVQGQLF